MIGKIFDDYMVTDVLDRRNNSRYYKLKCNVCGHEKECSRSNILRQDNHHSCKNCKEDYYSAFVGKAFGDYICTSIEHISEQKCFMATLECRVCGHKIVTHTTNMRDRRHSAYTCKIDYHRSLIGKRYGDLEITGIDGGYCHNAILYACKCSKCGIMSIETMSSIKRNIKHGSHCFKLIPDDEYKTVISRRFNLMDMRCNNPKCEAYSHYGARGIKLLYENAVDLYLDFIDELREHAQTYGIRNSTFDRIDVNGNYEKSNLRITTQCVQSTNTTRKRLFIIEKDGIRVISDSAMECGRRLNINGHGVGNVVAGRSHSCGGWVLYRILDPSESVNEVINSEGVTTNLIVA